MNAKTLNCLAALALASAITAISALADEELDTSPAMSAAQSWLSLVDAGRQDESWDQAAAIFREKIPKVKWQTAVEAARGPLGVLIARKMRSATYARTLPDAPPGDYLVIVYDSRFENLPHATETVTPMREKDGTWKVAGYFIR
ncbi:MAG: DUF4019 domain-containing protein [Usitatibacter sp.]